MSYKMRFVLIYKIFAKKFCFAIKNIFISFFFLSLYAYALEPQNITIESSKTLKIQIKGLNKFMILNPDIARVEFTGNELLITGMKMGKTALYVWKGKEFIPYVINTLTFKYPENIIINNKEIQPNTSYGNYITSILSNSKDNTQLLKHSILFKSYFDESSLNFFADIDNILSAFKEVKEIRLNDFYFGYQSKLYDLNIGNIKPLSFNIYKEGAFYSLEGLNLSYTQDESKKISIFAGTPYKSISLFGNNNYLSKDYFILGTSIFYKPQKNLDFFGDGILNTDEAKKSSLSLGMNFEPIKLMQIYSNLETNFLGLSNITKIDYKNIFEKTKELFQCNFEYKYFKNNAYIPNQSMASLSMSFFHQSLTLLSFRDDFQKYDTNFRNLSSFSVSKSFTDKFGINASTSISKEELDFIGTFQLGFSSNYFIPLTLNYAYTTGNNSNHQINSYIKLFSSESFSLFSSFYFRQNIEKIEREFVNNNNLFFNLVTTSNLTKDFSLSSELAYNLSTNPFYKKQQDFILRLSCNYKINSIHEINFNVNFNKNDYDKNNIFFNPNILLTYSYLWDSSLNGLKREGEIKGVVFDDSNGNGIFDKNEKILPNIDISIRNSSKIIKSIKTSNSGYSTSIEYGTYEISFDDQSLPKGYKPKGAFPEIVTLSEKIREVNFPVSNKINISGIVYNSKSKLSGIDNIVVVLDNKIRKETDLDGSFSFVAEKGEHTIKIDYTSIPNGYTVIGKGSKSISVTEINNELFFILNPVRNLKGSIFNIISNKPATNFTFDIKYFCSNQIISEKITTDENGEFLLRDLEEGSIEISSPFIKKHFKLLIENKPIDLKITIPAIIQK